MKYSLTATALASLAVGSSALARGYGHAHQHLHERAAEPKVITATDPQYGVITFTMGDAAGATSAPAAQNVKAEAAATTQAGAAQSSKAPAAPASSAASSAGGDSSSSGSSGGAGLPSWIKVNGGGSSVVGTDSSIGPNKMVINNKSGKDMNWVCWSGTNQDIQSAGASSATPVKNGGSVTVYAPNTGSTGYDQGPGCGPAFADTKWTNAGQLAESWLEFNLGGSSATFDLSNEALIKGTPMSISGGGCTSSPSSCNYVCTTPDPNTGTSCWGGQPNTGKYDLINQGASAAGGKCGSGQSSNGGTGGGCQVSGPVSLQVDVGSG